MPKIRTRFAPSPTGFMHIGNLRTALYSFLIAKSSKCGEFILRIEDTDQGRLIEGATQLIYSTLSQVGLAHDEGPDIGGNFGPYVQSERLQTYMTLAQQLVDKGKAYYCFCPRLEQEEPEIGLSGYNRKCRNLSGEEIKRNLKQGKPYVIRQKMPLEGQSTFTDAVYGAITIEHSELEDQILIKTDGFPTYNFANVADDHAMGITHIVRGCEYLTSTPKYNLLYEAFGWQKPDYIHLPLIMGKNEDGSVSKLSKRHGATGFNDLISDGYLSEAITNYIALLGWCPKDTQEIFSLQGLIQNFSIEGISKSPAIFDYDKLTWFNAEYLRNKSDEEFLNLCMPYFKEVFKEKPVNYSVLTSILRPRVTKLTQIGNLISFFVNLPNYDVSLFENKKSKSTVQTSLQMLKLAMVQLQSCELWNVQEIHDCLINLAQKMEIKNGTLLWPVRIALSGTSVTSGGAIEILAILGKEESIARIDNGIKKLEAKILV